MVTLQNVTHSFGPQTVLDDVNITIDGTSRSALVGANGSGKTTLLRIIGGVLAPDRGERRVARGHTVAWLPQHLSLDPQKTVEETAEKGFDHERNLLSEREAHAHRLEADPHDRAALERIAEIDLEIETSPWWERHARIGKVLAGLGFSPERMDRPVGTLSGGWRMRVALARTLLSRPSLLLLDEPTNYLDSEARLWLSRFLSDYRGGVLLVSHDRAFLDETVNTVYELFLASLRRYTGNYSRYTELRAAELDHLRSAWTNQQKEIRRQEDFIRRFRANASKARQVKSRVRSLETLDRIELPVHMRPISISLPSAPHSARTMVRIEGLSKSYGSVRVLNDLDLTILRGQRIAVVGRNGAGKSTLLRILAGDDASTDGTVTIGTGVRIAYFAQDHPETLPKNETILEYVTSRASAEAQSVVRDTLGSFLFGEDDIEKPLGVLSGGERTRLAMATLLLRPANLLVLDEPTNHLDMTSQEVLARALSTYDGSVVIVSHDRFFLRQMATDVLALRPDPSRGAHWRVYPGSFVEFESSTMAAILDESPPKDQSDSTVEAAPAVETPSGRTAYERQKREQTELRRLLRREEELLEAIDRLEKLRDEIHHELSDPAVYTDADASRDAQDRLGRCDRQLASVVAEWESVSHEIETRQG